MARKLQLVAALVALCLAATATARPLLPADPDAAPAGGEPSLQLDVCNLSNSPSMVLTATSEGMCTITNRILPAAGANATADGSSLQFHFKCNPTDYKSQPRLEGPALNLWAGVTRTTGHDASAAAAGGSCALTTLNPVLYFHRQTPPLFHYGYSVKGLPCSAVAAGDRAAPTVNDLTSTATPQAADTTVGVVYGLALVPALPTPSMAPGSPEKAANARFFSTAPQSCKLVVTAMGRSFMYESSESFPCNLVVDPEKSLGAGRCFGSR